MLHVGSSNVQVIRVRGKTSWQHHCLSEKDLEIYMLLAFRALHPGLSFARQCYYYCIFSLLLEHSNFFFPPPNLKHHESQCILACLISPLLSTSRETKLCENSPNSPAFIKDNSRTSLTPLSATEGCFHSFLHSLHSLSALTSASDILVSLLYPHTSPSPYRHLHHIQDEGKPLTKISLPPDLSRRSTTTSSTTRS